MRCVIAVVYCSIASVGLVLAISPKGFSAGEMSVSISAHQVRYVSGEVVHVEELVGNRWVGRSWRNDGQIKPNEGWDENAFEVRIKTGPQTEDPGKLLTNGWQWLSASELPRTQRGSLHFLVQLSNSLLPVKVGVHTLLDGTPVLTRWLEITNTSDESMALTGLSPWSGCLWSGDATVSLGHSLRREVPWEGWFGWTPLTPGPNIVKITSPGPDVIRNDTDRLWDDPYFVLRNESREEYFFGELAWPANYFMEFRTDDGVTFKIGPTAVKALRVIAPGEMIKTPAVHLGYVKGDFDSAVQVMHEHIRRSVLPTRDLERSYKIQYLIPEDWSMTVYRGDEFNETNMKKCMDVAAAVGIEAFILDGPMWDSAYGNWLVPNTKSFPNGLAPLADYAHKRRLLFGLYAETEGGRDGFSESDGASIGGWKQSEIYKEHPEWFPSMNLNLAIPEAASYLESEISKMIDLYKLDLYRHDQNGIVFFPPGPGSGQTLRDRRFIESNYWRHYEALYTVFANIHARYPNLILQQAAAGNFRLDLGTVGAFHEQFTSDRASMPYVYRMLSGMSVYLPPETLVNSNGMAYPKDLPDIDTTLRGAYTLGNTPMIFNAILPKSVEELKPEVREKFLHYANLYKSFIRPLLPTCEVYHHAPVNGTGGVESGSWFAMEFTSPDRSKGWATIIHLSKTEPEVYVFKPKGLDGRRKYAVTFDSTGRTTLFDGSDLMRDGLAIRPEASQASELLLWKAIDASKR